MDEKQETKDKPAPENTNEGNKPESIGLIDRAHEAAERLEQANKKQEELIRREEELAAKRTLGGRADYQGEPEKKVEETPQDYAKKVARGEVNPFKE